MGLLHMRPPFVLCFAVCIWSIPLPSSGQSSDLAPASQSVAPAILTLDSGRKSSPAGKNWSDWYELGTGKAPEGYTLDKAEFWLTGDRRCGESAECREVVKSDQEVLWQFRLQGKKPDGLSKVAFSEGHLRVIYRAQ
jgi:hypothetical protein